MKTVKSPKNETTWTRTQIQNLQRHKSGSYYARTYSRGKENWKSLKTKKLGVAKARLAEFLKEFRQNESTLEAALTGDMTFGDAVHLYLKRLEENVSLKPSTRYYWRQVVTALQKSWPQLENLDIRRITPSACREWAAKFSKKSSASRYNNTISAMKHIFDVAVDAGARFGNPTKGLRRLRVALKPVDLPSKEQFSRFVKAIETAGGGCSRDCADLVRFLAFSGCRTSEAKQVEWRDIDFEREEIVVRGDPETGTKNREIRRIPMIPDLKILLQRMRSQHPNEPGQQKALRVNEAQKAMDRAAKRVEMKRITHHSLRHLYATICIESGIDVPTVSRWLGHKDGGALAMKVYGHLRHEHSKAAAQKVCFGCQS